MRVPYYQVDAFTDRLFSGNPAGICPLDRWLPDELLQQIATENNLSETAFFTSNTGSYHLRWFTPAMEVDLCGHATLAPAHVLFSELGYKQDRIRFQTRSGVLSACRLGDRIELDFPSRPGQPCPTPDALVRGLGRPPRQVLKARDYLVVFDSEAEVASLQPDMNLLMQLDCLGIIATGPGRDTDFVSRFFAPRAGVPEDPVTGSSHSTLIPFWSERLGKRELHARQISRRGGEIYCRHLGERVGIAGRAVIYARGELDVPVD